MPKRGWLGLAAVVVLAGSVWLWWLLAPHGGQIGGLGHVVPFTYPLMAAGLVMLVFSLPRRFRVRAGLALLLALALFFGLWPSWEGNAFPNRVTVATLFWAVDPRGTGRPPLCVYTKDGGFWATGDPAGVVAFPVADRITGFYAAHLPLRARIAVMSWGFRLRPVWPGSARTSY